MMVRSSFSAQGALTACLLCLPATLLVGACSSSSSTTSRDAQASFGDGAIPRHDATTPKPDASKSHHDAATDVKHKGDAQTDSHTDGLVDGKVDGKLDGTVDAKADGTLDGQVDALVDAMIEPGDAAPLTSCVSGIQCNSNVCKNVADAGWQCQPSTCTDGVKNGTETDVDCGGGACPKCGDEKKCLVGHQDCVSGECGIGTQGGACNPGDAGPGGCVCEAPTCDDRVLNGTESDVDCGSSGSCPAGETCQTCSSCTTGKTCGTPKDCISDTCNDDVCSCPPGMTEASTSVNIPYCIDAYEATYNEYTAFMQAHEVTEQPAFCAWNTSYHPTDNFPQLQEWSNLPITNINWCDAYMYCHTAVPGKHLCGQIANPSAGVNEGDPISPSDANNPLTDEWYNACSDQGANEYPYSANQYDDGAFCNGSQSLVQAAWESGCNSITPGYGSPRPTVCAGETYSIPTYAGCGDTAYWEADCIGGTSNALYDMSGNVAEWENSCASYLDGGGGDAGADGGMTDLCNVRGGSYVSGAAGLTCKTNSAQPPRARDVTADDIGIRCCL